MQLTSHWHWPASALKPLCLTQCSGRGPTLLGWMVRTFDFVHIKHVKLEFNYMKSIIHLQVRSTGENFQTPSRQKTVFLLLLLRVLPATGNIKTVWASPEMEDEDSTLVTTVMAYLDTALNVSTECKENSTGSCFPQSFTHFSCHTFFLNQFCWSTLAFWIVQSSFCFSQCVL